MNLKISLHLLLDLFSFKRSNMRFFNLKRILIVFFLLPIFIFFLILNNVFLLLDFLLFPSFIKKEIKHPVYIIAAPRSATTMMLYSLSKDNKNYSSIALWEILFAPSIIQKKICLFINKIDRSLGSPIRKLVLKIENVISKGIKAVHLTGLNQPEEDAALLIWSLNSVYLNFFYPDSVLFNELLAFDKEIPEAQRHRIFKQYKRLIQRHMHVFDPKGQKVFLSKNPSMMSSTQSLINVFPDVRIININRCPAKTIPSSIALFNSFYKLFTSRAESQYVNQKTEEIIIEWYQMLQQTLDKYPMNFVVVSFDKLIQFDPVELNLIASFLGLQDQILSSTMKKEVSEKNHISANKYQAYTSDQLSAVLEKIPFMKEYCKMN